MKYYIFTLSNVNCWFTNLQFLYPVSLQSTRFKVKNPFYKSTIFCQKQIISTRIFSLFECLFLFVVDGNPRSNCCSNLKSAYDWPMYCLSCNAALITIIRLNLFHDWEVSYYYTQKIKSTLHGYSNQMRESS